MDREEGEMKGEGKRMCWKIQHTVTIIRHPSLVSWGIAGPRKFHDGGRPQDPRPGAFGNRAPLQQKLSLKDASTPFFGAHIRPPHLIGLISILDRLGSVCKTQSPVSYLSEHRFC